MAAPAIAPAPVPIQRPVQNGLVYGRPRSDLQHAIRTRFRTTGATRVYSSALPSSTFHHACPIGQRRVRQPHGSFTLSFRPSCGFVCHPPFPPSMLANWLYRSRCTSQSRWSLCARCSGTGPPSCPRPAPARYHRLGVAPRLVLHGLAHEVTFHLWCLLLAQPSQLLLDQPPPLIPPIIATPTPPRATPRVACARPETTREKLLAQRAQRAQKHQRPHPMEPVRTQIAYVVLISPRCCTGSNGNNGCEALRARTGFQIVGRCWCGSHIRGSWVSLPEEHPLAALLLEMSHYVLFMLHTYKLQATSHKLQAAR